MKYAGTLVVGKRLVFQPSDQIYGSGEVSGGPAALGPAPTSPAPTPSYSGVGGYTLPTNFPGSTPRAIPLEDPVGLVRGAAANGFDGVDFDALIDKYRKLHAPDGSTGRETHADSAEESLLTAVVSDLASQVERYERARQPERAREPRDAVVGGTLRIEDPAIVPGPQSNSRLCPDPVRRMRQGRLFLYGRRSCGRCRNRSE